MAASTEVAAGENYAARTFDRTALAAWVRHVRAQTETLIVGLSPEDMTIQSMPDVSPTKWHLAHTSWFFETFVLIPLAAAAPFDPHYNYLFNSYYDAVGARYPRAQRGLVGRPGVAEILDYRRHVTAAILKFIDDSSADQWQRAAPLIELGLHHEQQHQELILMDIKHVLSMTPLLPTYRLARPRSVHSTQNAEFVTFAGGEVRIGHHKASFAFDNEGPPHTVWLDSFALQDRLVTCGEYLNFIADGGYRRPELWLADGWAMVEAHDWSAPLYWRRDAASADGWQIFTLNGEAPVALDEPVVHVSHYEADAFARWAGARLPTEFEWEHAATTVGARDNPARNAGVHPLSTEPARGLKQVFGDVWQWTASAYLPYPRFRPSAGAVGEYNGKFMSGQMVLRGSCAATPPGHSRTTYRNFFPPHARWCFSGLRLAQDI